MEQEQPSLIKEAMAAKIAEDKKRVDAALHEQKALEQKALIILEERRRIGDLIIDEAAELADLLISNSVAPSFRRTTRGAGHFEIGELKWGPYEVLGPNGTTITRYGMCHQKVWKSDVPDVEEVGWTIVDKSGGSYGGWYHGSRGWDCAPNTHWHYTVILYTDGKLSIRDERGCDGGWTLRATHDKGEQLVPLNDYGNFSTDLSANRIHNSLVDFAIEHLPNDSRFQ